MFCLISNIFKQDVISITPTFFITTVTVALTVINFEH